MQIILYLCKIILNKMRCFRVSLLILSLAVAVMAIVAGCVGNTSQSTKIVTVTLPPQKYIVEQIAGDRLDVRCLLSNGANP